MRLNCEERGLYREMLDYCTFEGSLPDDQALLQKIASVTPEEFSRSWPAVSKCFPVAKDGRLHNSKVERVLSKISAYRKQRQEAGRKGGQSRLAHAKHVLSEVEDTGLSESLTYAKPLLVVEEGTCKVRVPSVEGGRGNRSLADEFHRWFAQYPKQVKMETAARSWLHLVDRGEITEETLPEVFAGLERWKGSKSWAAKDGEYIQDPATFLTGNDKQDGRMWKDHPPQTDAARTDGKKSSLGIDPSVEWVPPDWMVADAGGQ